MTFYIGKEPTIGNYAKMDSISAVNGQATYNLLKGGVAFAPQSANHVICSLNSIIQNPGSSFTISGSQIIFASNLQTGDSIDFILVLGDVLSIGTPSDDTIDSAKLKTNSVVEAKIQNNAVTTDKINNDAVTIDKINLISTTSAPSLEAKGTSGQTDGYIQLNCEQNSHGIKLKSPSHSSSQSYTIIMPDNQIAQNKFMKVKSITGSGSTAVGQLEFADAGGGQWTHLLTQTASNSSSLDFSSTYITTTYLDYQIVMSGIKIATDSQYPRLLLSTDNGSSYLSSYRNVRIGRNDYGTDLKVSQNASSGLYMANSGSMGNATEEIFNGIVTIFDPLKQSGTTGSYTCATSHVAYHDDVTRINLATTSHSTNTATAINNIRFDIATSNITSGKVSLYGRKLS